MGQLLLKMLFYLVAGVILSAITWSTLSHSAVTGDYALSIILLVMMFFIVGKFFVDRWQPKHSPQDFHPTKLWKMPRETTTAGLWLRVGFGTLVSIALFTVLSAVLVFTTTARPPFMLLLGALFLLRIPHLYWNMRGYYEPALPEGDEWHSHVLRYRGGSDIHARTRWLVPTAMAGIGGILAAVGLLAS